MPQEAIFDIGAHNGNDSAYYLSLGYRVIAVEANPLLAEQCRLRFAEEILSERMILLNVGILDQPGRFTFHRSLRDDEWSSFVPGVACKPGEWEQIPIECITLQDMVKEYGVPYFVKIDIEGADLQAISTLTRAEAPPYISVELNAGSPIVDRLIELGYGGFKFVDGETYRSTLPIFEHETVCRALRKMGRLVPTLRPAIAKLPPMRDKSEYDPPGKYSPDGYPFGPAHSGPFGEGAFGVWMDPANARRWFSRLVDLYRAAGRERTLWWDVHARLGGSDGMSESLRSSH